MSDQKSTRKMQFVLVAYTVVGLEIDPNTELDDVPQEIFDEAIDKARSIPTVPDWDIDNWYWCELPGAVSEEETP